MTGKLIVSFIHNESIKTRFMMAALHFLQVDRASRNVCHDPALMCVTGDYSDARNIVPREFLKTNADVLAVVDTDVIFTPQQMYLLYDAIDPVERPVVSALAFTYLTTAPFPMPLWFDHAPSGEYSTVKQVTPGLQKIEAFGFSMQLFHRSALEKMLIARHDDPWTWFPRELISVRGEPVRLGDDMSFGFHAEKLGIPIYGHGDVQVGHFKSRVENAATYYAGNEFIKSEIKKGNLPPEGIVFRQIDEAEEETQNGQGQHMVE